MKRYSDLNPSGHTESMDLWGKITKGQTWMCFHCNSHHQIVKGSGKLRAFCLKCVGPVCVGCANKCVPIEQMLENIEHDRPLDYYPIMISVDKEPPKNTILKE